MSRRSSVFTRSSAHFDNQAEQKVPVRNANPNEVAAVGHVNCLNRNDLRSFRLVGGSRVGAPSADLCNSRLGRLSHLEGHKVFQVKYLLHSSGPAVIQTNFIPGG